MVSIRSQIGPAQQPGATLFVALGLASGQTPRQQSMLAKSISGIARIWPLMLVTHLLVIGLLVPLAPEHSVHDAYVIAAAAACILVDLMLCIGVRLPIFRRLATHRQLTLLLPLAILSAVCFSLWALVLNRVADGQLTVQLTLVQFGVALIATAIFGGQRLLSLGYCAGLTIIVGIEMPDKGLAGGLLLFMAIIAAVTLAQAHRDLQILRERQRSELSGERAERLLTEYEEAGRGWFWETDRDGAITYVSETLARGLGKSADELIGQPMTSIILAPRPGEDADGQRTLSFHFTARTAFSDIAVRAANTKEDRWWSISGRPVINQFGHFFGFRGSGTDLTDMKRSQAEVARLAQFDSLTGLANRVQMQRTLEQSIVDKMGRPANCALFLLDLDRFKEVNDTLGHPAGDALLKQVSKRLERIIGNRGQVGRLGGDEFQIVLPGETDHNVLARTAESIIQTVSQPYAIEGSQVVIGVSIGIAMAPTNGVTSDALIRNADLALYSAKGDGRGVHRFFVPEMHADAEDRRQLEADLRVAIADGGLHLEYQPVVSATTEQITGFEALVRWNHPVRGAISPGVFIPIAEDTGLITAIGEWVLRTACHEASHWPDKTRIAVNVSPIQFANPALPNVILNALSNAGLSAERLELEITEGVFLHESNDTEAMFASLKRIGVRLALDDFGTGYSSLGYLKRAPFDKIKIDQSFVRGASVKGNRNGAIVKSIVSLAEALDMETTAEGAETIDELELIRSLGCSHVQGFIYGRPMPASDVMAIFERGETHAKVQGHQSSRPVRRTMLRTIEMACDGHSYQGRVRNISVGGALIEGLYNVPPGTRFIVTLARDYTVAAVCRWSKDERMGVEFEVPIDLGILASAPPESARRNDPMRKAG